MLSRNIQLQQRESCSNNYGPTVISQNPNPLAAEGYRLANFIPEEKVAEIKDAADIVELISEAVLLRKTGKNHIGLCPFHSEKTPSFTVSPDKQIFHCFGCGEGGNVFHFVMKHDGLSFPDAIKLLARRYGIDIPQKEMSRDQKRAYSQKEAIYELNRVATGFFIHALRHPDAGQKARHYFQNRKLQKSVIEQFSLGFAPDGWDGLLLYLQKKGVSTGMAESAGLIVPRKTGTGHYDRFRNRIVFPILNTSKRVIGFGGRVLDDSLPKYLNSPETPIYNKSRSLYGLSEARSAARTERTVFVVEGYIDVLALYQNGIQNVVATLGTSLTDEHVQILRNLVGDTGRIYLIYDSDDAGLRAAERSVDIFRRGHAELRIMVLPTGYDPDSFIMSSGKESFLKEVEKAQSIITFLLNSVVKRHGLSLEGKSRVVSEMAGHITTVRDNVKRALFVSALSEKIGVPEAAVMEKIRRLNGSGKRPPGMPAPAKPGVSGGGQRGNGASRLEERIVSMILQYPQSLEEVEKNGFVECFENPVLKTIVETALACREEDGVNTRNVLDNLSDDDIRKRAVGLTIQEEEWDIQACRKLIEQFTSVGARKGDDLVRQIRAAEGTNNRELLMNLLQEKQTKAMRQKK